MTGCTEETLRNIFNTLRSNHPEWMITSYTYDYDTGITSQTDPNGYTTYYEYDQMLRLSKIKDMTGVVLKSHEYHYKD